MKRWYIGLLIMSFVSLGLTTSCGGEEDDVRPMDLLLMEGVWEVMDQGSQDVFERGCLIDITFSSEMAEGAYHGYITAFYLASGGTPVHDKVYGWSIRGVENHLPLLDLVLLGEADGDNQWEGNYYYRIIRLSDSYMWWQGNSNGDSSTVKFRRHPDIQSI